MTNDKVINEVIEERKRQDAKWGEQNHCPEIWHLILAEEYGEAAKELCDSHFNLNFANDPNGIREAKLRSLRAELIQTAAVAIAFIQSLDRNELA